MSKVWEYLIVLPQIAAGLCLLALRPDLAILFCILSSTALSGEALIDAYWPGKLA